MLVALFAGLLAAACGGEATGRCVAAHSGEEFCDELVQGGYDAATAYEISRQECRHFTVKQIAKRYASSRDPDLGRRRLRV